MIRYMIGSNAVTKAATEVNAQNSLGCWANNWVYLKEIAPISEIIKTNN
jgi:hypothetical protein